MSAHKWWHRAVFYQIYPRSFADHNPRLDNSQSRALSGDGIGDIPGIIQRLDYLKDLGIDGIWLSPHFPSPLFDCGYDITDYTDVAPEYGSLADFKRFLEECHKRDIRLILDLVLNHTSDRHPWFMESCSSRQNPKHDWYIWHAGRPGGQPPNNWMSTFGGSAWEYVPEVDQYYYHFFFKEQPDLNWRNPEVKEAMFDAARFWLDMGVDGFRLDAIGTVFEDPELPDHPATMSQAEIFRAIRLHRDPKTRHVIKQTKLMNMYQVDLPEMHGLMQELRAVLDEYDDRMLVGENERIEYCAEDELHLVFNFPLTRLKHITPLAVRRNQKRRLAELDALNCPEPGAWPCNTLGNHDSPRLISQFGDGRHDAQIARLLAALMLTLKGTPFLYNGEEIGMRDFMLQNRSQVRDELGNWYYELETKLIGTPPDEAFQIAMQNSRDKTRTPMQWSNEPNAGFSPAGVNPWLPVNPDYARGVNVADQMNDPSSLLNFYKSILTVRRQNEALITGEYLTLEYPEPAYHSVLAFVRSLPGENVLVALNFSARRHLLDLSEPIKGVGVEQAAYARTLFTVAHRPELTPLSSIEVLPWEVYIAKIS